MWRTFAKSVLIIAGLLYAGLFIFIDNIMSDLLSGWQLWVFRLFILISSLFLIRKSITKVINLGVAKDKDEACEVILNDFGKEEFPAYEFGRLLAVYAHIENIAIGTEKRSTRQRYQDFIFKSPLAAWDTLIEKSNCYMRQIDQVKANEYRKQIELITTKFQREAMPGNLSSSGKDESSFIQGFFLQDELLKESYFKGLE